MYFIYRTNTCIHHLSMQTFSSASPVPIYFRCDVINTANAQKYC